MYWGFWKDEVVQVTFEFGNNVRAATEDQTRQLAELFPDVIYFEAGPEELEL